MRWIILISAILSKSAMCDNEIMNEFNDLNKKKAEYITDMLMEEKRKNIKKSNGINREIDIKKPLKECIKPNNVIDEDVVKCMEGK